MKTKSPVESLRARQRREIIRKLRSRYIPERHEEVRRVFLLLNEARDKMSHHLPSDAPTFGPTYISSLRRLYEALGKFLPRAEGLDRIRGSSYGMCIEGDHEIPNSELQQRPLETVCKKCRASGNGRIAS